MSSNTSHLDTNIAENILIDDIKSLVTSGKTIIPFHKEHFLCQSISAREDIAYLDLDNYSAVEEYSAQDQIITVQTGIKVKALQDFLLKERKWFPFAYYDDETSLLDIILSGETGSLEQLFGGLSRHILGLSSILANGQLIKSGGKVVKNVSGYDLTRFFIGSYGYFALPIRAHIRLHALPQQSVTFLIQSDESKSLLSLASHLINTNANFAYLDLFDNRLLSTLSEPILKCEKQFVLTLRIFGDSLTVEAESATIQTILASNKSSFSIISATAEQDQLMHQLSQISWFTNKISPPKLKKSRIIDVSIKNKDMSQLLNASKIISFPFVYKILSNRLRFCLDSLSDQDSLIKSLNTFALANKINLLSAYGDNTYIRRVNNLGYDTNNGDQLVSVKKRLKAQFDPQNLFNPYVEL